MVSVFSPKMQTEVEGVTVLGDLHWRAWDGVVADVWDVAFADNVRGEYVSPDPRLVITLDRIGDGDIHLQTSPSRAAQRAEWPLPANYVPAGMRLWSNATELRGIKHLDIHFDMATLRARFGDGLDHDKVNTPRLMFQDERVMGLARLIAAECVNPDHGNGLFGDSLIAALVVALWAIEPGETRKRGQLTKPQVQQLIDYVEANCLRNIRLQELADITGLSPAYVGRAFKASTGMALHSCQMKARVDQVKLLLANSKASLTETAHVTGFADQAHLTRVFRRVVGTTPAVWQRSRNL
jgi:AraC family transcriptional regulator